ncbi:Fc.00g093760.m01.CDS01 [Cosmosporella sp. VM-42]
MEGGSAHAGAGFVRSTVSHMLRWAAAVMQSESHQSADDTFLPNMDFTHSTHQVVMPEPAEGENTDGLGWFRHTIPSRWLGSVSPNFMLLPDPPVIGQQSSSRLVICHYGAFGRFLTAFYTFPETRSAIIIMANSSPSRGDPTDLTAQCLCQELFDMKLRVALEAFANRAPDAARLI